MSHKLKYIRQNVVFRQIHQSECILGKHNKGRAEIKCYNNNNDNNEI